MAQGEMEITFYKLCDLSLRFARQLSPLWHAASPSPGLKGSPRQPVRPRAPGAALIVMMVCWWCHWRNGGVSAVICLQSALFATRTRDGWLAANERTPFLYLPGMDRARLGVARL